MDGFIELEGFATVTNFVGFVTTVVLCFKIGVLLIGANVFLVGCLVFVDKVWVLGLSGVIGVADKVDAGFGFTILLNVVFVGVEVVFKIDEPLDGLCFIGFLFVVCGIDTDSTVFPGVETLFAEMESPVFPKIAGKIELHDDDVSGVSNLLYISDEVKLLFTISECRTFCTLLTMSRIFASLSTISVGFFARTAGCSLSPLATMLWISSIVIRRLTNSPSSLKV